jgi:hypothetical protein
MRRLVAILFLATLAAADLKLPLRQNSVRFAVIGDNGTGGKHEYETAQQMATWHERFPFSFVLMLGDNLYGHERASDFQRKFEDPYQPLLSIGVQFYASLGNHDDPSERFYKPFHMGGNRYYEFTAGNAEFLALDSNYMDPKQIEWIKKQLQDSKAAWKICFFHHPLYSDGKFHGPNIDLREVLEPVFEEYGVKLVFSGHEHVYERLKPRNGVNYFVLGNSGELRPHNLRPSAEMAKGFDTDRAFLLVEISGDQCFFQTISRLGETVDAGVIQLEGIRSAAASGE